MGQAGVCGKGRNFGNRHRRQPDPMHLRDFPAKRSSGDTQSPGSHSYQKVLSSLAIALAYLVAWMVAYW